MTYSPPDTRPWNSTEGSLPESRVLVETKIHDEHGSRHETTLFFERGCWFIPESGERRYFTPTHWRPILEFDATQPAYDVSEALTEMLERQYSLSRPRAARARLLAAAILAVFEVRPRKRLTGAEVERIREEAGKRFVFMQPWEVRVILDAAARVAEGNSK